MKSILFLAPALLFTAVALDDDALTLEELRELSAEISDHVEDLRGLQFETPVAVEIVDQDWFDDYAAERADKMMPEAERRAGELAAKLLGVIPADMDLEQAEIDLVGDQALAFYEPSNDTFYVIEGRVSGPLLEVTLAHELTHAIDDLHFDIDGTLMPLARVNSDAMLAYHAVVEGSGTGIMNRWMVRELQNGRFTYSEIMEAQHNPSMEEVPDYLWKPLTHSYLRGAAFLARTSSVMAGQTKAAAVADIDEALDVPPASTEQILHPEKYWGEERDEPREVAFDTAGLPNGWELLREDTLGELILGIVTTPLDARGAPSPEDPMAMLRVEYTNEAVEGWGGDRIALLGRGEARVLRLATVWDTVEDADEFYAALEAILPHLRSSAAAVDELHGETGHTHVSLEKSEDQVLATVAVGVEDVELARVVGGLGVRSRK